MGKTISCPACGNRGDSSDDVTFEVRGKHNGLSVRKCLRCDTGLYVKAIGKPRPIQPAVWEEMQRRWDEAFGSDEVGDNATEAESQLYKATEAVADELTENDLLLEAPFATWCLVHQAVLTTYYTLAELEKTDAWSDLSINQAKAALKVGAGLYVLTFFDDPENRSVFSEGLDVKPSRVQSEMWRQYANAMLADDIFSESRDLGLAWEDDDKSKFAITLDRRLREVTGIDEGEPDLEESMLVFYLFMENRKVFDDAYWERIREDQEDGG